jgi:zinc transport system ATP-binding protein
MPVIEIERLNFSYANVQILQDINLQVAERDFLALVGPNGGGKTTLLKLILGLLQPTQGQIKVFAATPISQRNKLGYVAQFANFPRDFPITVQDAVLMGRLGISSNWLGFNQQDKQIANQMMQLTEISDLSKRRIANLSGGQLQRVLIARALTCQPQILILDEPTANIDLRLETDIFDLLKLLNQELTIIVVSHDIGFISAYTSKVACLNKTLLCHQTAPLTAEHIQKLYNTQVRAIQHNHYN